MINGLGVVGWGVGGIEAEAVHARPADLHAHARGRRLRAHRPLPGRDRDRPRAHRHADAAQARRRRTSSSSSTARPRDLSLADRATIANMAPEYGATMGFFPVDDRDDRYLRALGRTDELCALVEATARRRACGATRPRPSRVQQHARRSTSARSSRRSPARSARRIASRSVAMKAAVVAPRSPVKDRGFGQPRARDGHVQGASASSSTDGDVVIAAITSCTNTSNPA
jgi:aconitate hydratase